MSKYLFVKTLIFVVVCKEQVYSTPVDNLKETNLHDDKHGIVMGRPSHTCDDAKTKLNVDWDGSPVNYTCFTPKSPFPILNINSTEECFHVPSGYVPQHYCMDRVIEYKELIPTFGDHRPLWPIYGEYNFVPRQRWLHNIEHGAVVMLYDPCAHPAMVNKLRELVTKCLRRHVITSSNHLSPNRPLTLVAWGCRLSMNMVDEHRVTSFIKKHALKGPEGHVSQDGQYDLGLIKKAQPLKNNVDEDADLLCS